MMRRLRLSRFYLAAAILLAVLGSLMLYGYLHRLEMRVARNGRIIRVPVAGTDIAAGSVISPDMLLERDFPDIYLLPAMMARGEEVVGRTALRDISAGEPLLRDSLSATSEGGRAALLLGPGRRAYPVDLQDNVVPLGDLRAGDRVDVIFVPPQGAAVTVLRSAQVLCLPIYSTPGEGGAEQAEALLQGSTSPWRQDPGGQLLLSVAPEEAETLAEAEERGRLVISVCPAVRD
jgi:Flp pilus assembly protein CpaB